MSRARRQRLGELFLQVEARRRAPRFRRVVRNSRRLSTPPPRLRTGMDRILRLPAWRLPAWRLPALRLPAWRLPGRRSRVPLPGWSRAAIAAAASAFLYVAAQAALADSVPRDTSVLGIPVGGMSGAEAREALSAPLSEAATAPVVVEAVGWRASIDPAQAGMRLDVEATLGRVSGFTLSPRRLWWHLVGGGEVGPEVQVDRSALEPALDRAIETVERGPLDAGVVFREGGLKVVPHRLGVDVDDAAALDILAEGWPAPGVIALPAATAAPDVSEEEAHAFARRLEQEVLSEPATLLSERGDVVVLPEDLYAFGSVVSQEGRLRYLVDGVALAAELEDRHPEVRTAPVDARFAFDKDHMLVIRPSQPGLSIDPAAVGDAAVLAAAGFSGTAPLPFAETPAETTEEDLRESPIKERVSSFSTPFTPRGASREHNIALAAKRVAGTIVMPGETFVLGEVIGPITYANGYVDAGVIIGGQHTTGVGGGLSQSATTMYNAAYFAGLEDVQHRPHTEWFARYPKGREATLATPWLDLKWKNNTPYPILINSYIEDARVYVDLWSTEHFEVESKTTVVSGRAIPGCGFTTKDERWVYLDGELVSGPEVYTWTYRRTESC